MSRTRELDGGGRAVEVEPERLAGFLDRFGASHGGITGTRTDVPAMIITAQDGWTASVACRGPDTPDTIDGLVRSVKRPLTVGLLLVRLGGYSVGVARDGTVLDSSTGRRQVHGRNAAGGQSQQRFARRREGQVRVALRATADAAVRMLVPRVADLDAVVLGGDRAALRELEADPRLAPVFAIARPGILDVPEPRRIVLDEAARRARCVEVELRPAR